MKNQFSRSEILLGPASTEILHASTVAVFGLGGVGSFAAEALVRSGVGTLVFIDHDYIDETNLNRQLLALQSTLGRRKVDVMAERSRDINPKVKTFTYPLYIDHASISTFDFSQFSYVVDCVDTLSAKLLLIERARSLDIPIISCMGTGNKLDAHFEIVDIEKTSMCPLARVLRRELRARSIKNVPVLFSRQEPLKLDKKSNLHDPIKTRPVVGSVPFVPSIAGLMLAGEVIQHLVRV